MTRQMAKEKKSNSKIQAKNSNLQKKKVPQFRKGKMHLVIPC